MTVHLPEFLQTQKYSAQRLRQAMLGSGLVGEGIVNFGDFAVTQRAAGANMSVDVAAGDAWVQGDNAARQGIYHVGNDGAVNLAIPAAHATLPRIDQVVLRVYDSTIIGGPTDNAVLEVVSGTATGGATLANRTGAAALPASALRLADVLVGAAVTKVENAQIGNPKDHKVGLAGYPAGSLSSVAGAPAPYAMGRPATYTPAVQAMRTAPQVIATATNAYIEWNGTDGFDLEAMHDAAVTNTRLKVVTPGLYSVGAMLVSALGGATSGMWARLNGASILGAYNAQLEVSGVGFVWSFGLPAVRLASGDYIEIGFKHNAGANREFTGNANLQWIGP